MVYTLYQRASMRQRKVFWFMCISLLVIVVYFHRQGPGHTNSILGSATSTGGEEFEQDGESCRKCSVKDVILDPHYQIVKHDADLNKAAPDTQIVYQLPSQTKGIVVLFHGCSHRATDFWPYASSCSRCVGLPEEVFITKVALSLGLAPIAVSSHFTPCWSERDAMIVANVLATWMQDNKLLKLPVFAVGASSGGSFVSAFSDKVNREPRLAELGVKIQAIDVQIASFSKIPKGLTSIALTRMSRDERTTDFAHGMAPELTRDNIAVLQNVAEPLPLSESFFYDRIEKMSRTDSKLLFRALQEGKFVDEKGFLLSDPRESDWRDVVTQRFPELLQLDSLAADESAISEEMNVAWAMHEFTGDFIRSTLEFFLVHVRP